MKKVHGTVKPGQAAPASGQYQRIGPRGGKGVEITAVKGKPMPPGEKPGSTYLLVDPTKHR
jgi:hypothetical protein